MKIQKITSQSRRDFYAIYECESCGHTEAGSGYDDSFFHQDVIPKMKCRKCGESAKNYKPLATKYPDSTVI